MYTIHETNTDWDGTLSTEMFYDDAVYHAENYTCDNLIETHIKHNDKTIAVVVINPTDSTKTICTRVA